MSPRLLARRWCRLLGVLRPRVPGLPADGPPLSDEDLYAFARIIRSWRHTAREQDPEGRRSL